MKISAVILTKNEEKNIERCLRSINFCDEIIVIDDYSEDRTINKIKNLNLKSQNKNLKLKIIQKRLNNDFSEQRNFAFEKTTNEWVLFLDADEELSKELRNEIKKLFFNNKKLLKKEIAGFYIKRRDYFWGREVKYGELRKIRQKGILRLIKKNTGRWIGKVHEEFRVKNSKFKILKLKNFINHYPRQNLKQFIQDINYYSSIRAKELFDQGKKANIFQIVFYPLGKFVLTYFLYLGFLDGIVGFTYSFMMSFHSFLARAKLYQYTEIDKLKMNN